MDDQCKKTRPERGCQFLFLGAETSMNLQLKKPSDGAKTLGPSDISSLTVTGCPCHKMHCKVMAAPGSISNSDAKFPSTTCIFPDERGWRACNDWFRELEVQLVRVATALIPRPKSAASDEPAAATSEEAKYVSAWKKRLTKSMRFRKLSDSTGENYVEVVCERPIDPGPKPLMLVEVCLVRLDIKDRKLVTPVFRCTPVCAEGEQEEAPGGKMPMFGMPCLEREHSDAAPDVQPAPVQEHVHATPPPPPDDLEEAGAAHDDHVSSLVVVDETTSNDAVAPPDVVTTNRLSEVGDTGVASVAAAPIAAIEAADAGLRSESGSKRSGRRPQVDMSLIMEGLALLNKGLADVKKRPPRKTTDRSKTASSS
jgi:hypothetical protein